MKSDFNATHYLTGQVVDGRDTNDLIRYEVRLYRLSFGNFAVISYISKQSAYDFCQTSKSLSFFSIPLESLNP